MLDDGSISTVLFLPRSVGNNSTWPHQSVVNPKVVHVVVEVMTR